MFNMFNMFNKSSNLNEYTLDEVINKLFNEINELKQENNELKITMDNNNNKLKLDINKLKEENNELKITMDNNNNELKQENNELKITIYDNNNKLNNDIKELKKNINKNINKFEVRHKNIENKFEECDLKLDEIIEKNDNIGKQLLTTYNMSILYLPIISVYNDNKEDIRYTTFLESSLINTISFNNNIQELDLSVYNNLMINWHNLRYFYNLEILIFNYSFDFENIISRFQYGKPKLVGSYSSRTYNYNYSDKSYYEYLSHIKIIEFKYKKECSLYYKIDEILYNFYIIFDMLHTVKNIIFTNIKQIRLEGLKKIIKDNPQNFKKCSDSFPYSSINIINNESWFRQSIIMCKKFEIELIIT